MRKRSQLLYTTMPALVVAIFGYIALNVDGVGPETSIGAILIAIVLMLMGVVSYLHRILYGEDGHE